MRGAMVFVVPFVIGICILCILTGATAAAIALVATLVIGFGLAGILYCIYMSKKNGWKSIIRCPLRCAG